MPIFACEVLGDAKPKIVRADSAAQARAHLVSCRALKASELADLIEDGAIIQRAGDTPPDPDPAEPEENAAEGQQPPAGDPPAETEKAGKAAK